MSLMKYKKKLNYSYTMGIYPTLELLEKAPDKVETVIFQQKESSSPAIQKIKDLCSKHRINFDIGPKVIQKVAIKENTWVIGVFKKYFSTLEESKDHIVLVNPSDNGNVGTIIRTMVGFGIKNLAIIRPAVDIFDPGVVRGSMGSIFEINYEYFTTFDEYTYKFPENKVYPFVLGGNLELGSFEFEKPASLVFGNEGSGLDDSFLQYPNTVTIKHSANIDSLNLAVATGVALYEFNSHHN